jgi:hypothetical protein
MAKRKDNAVEWMSDRQFLFVDTFTNKEELPL